MANLVTPLMTRYEMGRLAEIKAQGVPHEEAKSRVYAERGPSGQPRTGPPAPSAAPGSPAVPAASVAVSSAGLSPWWGILAILAVVIYFGSRKQATPIIVQESADDLESMPTGMMVRPKRKR